MKKFEVSWTAKLSFKRVIEANSKREAIAISEEIESILELAAEQIKISTMKAREVTA